MRLCYLNECNICKWFFFFCIFVLYHANLFIRNFFVLFFGYHFLPHAICVWLFCCCFILFLYFLFCFSFSVFVCDFNLKQFNVFIVACSDVSRLVLYILLFCSFRFVVFFTALTSFFFMMFFFLSSLLLSFSKCFLTCMPFSSPVYLILLFFFFLFHLIFVFFLCFVRWSLCRYFTHSDEVFCTSAFNLFMSGTRKKLLKSLNFVHSYARLQFFSFVLSWVYQWASCLIVMRKKQ